MQSLQTFIEPAPKKKRDTRERMSLPVTQTLRSAREIVAVGIFRLAKRPGAAGAGVLHGGVHVGSGRVLVDLELLAREDQVSVLDLVAVFLVDQRPLVGVAVDLALTGDVPEVVAADDGVRHASGFKLGSQGAQQVTRAAAFVVAHGGASGVETGALVSVEVGVGIDLFGQAAGFLQAGFVLAGSGFSRFASALGFQL